MRTYLYSLVAFYIVMLFGLLIINYDSEHLLRLLIILHIFYFAMVGVIYATGELS